MSTLWIAFGSIALYLLAYHTYGRWLARRIFRLDPEATPPSVLLGDDRDYVPTPKSIVFGHHFTSIAGTGPIVGPAIAILWGWLPALLWVLFGSIFIGAVHDFGALVVSLRNRGQTVGDIAGRVLNPRVRILFLLVLLFSLWIVLAIFGLVIANVFTMFPAAILPVFLQIPIAVWIGVRVHRRGRKLLVPSAIALLLMYLTVWFGDGCPGLVWDGGAVGNWIRSINELLQAWPIWVWTAILLAYCYVASVLPVWVLLQPRDYINSLQLLSSLGLVLAGLVAAAALGGPGGRPLEMVAPTVALSPLNAPPIIPFLFVTVACGAISGFHCLVSSGTSSKQLRREPDAQFVGYGSMLTEGFLAVVVILAVGAGIGFGWKEHPTFGALQGTELWSAIYADWRAADAGLGVKVGAFVAGAGNFLTALGIEHTMAKALLGVLVASFAGTTLDTATRLQRYVVQELSAAVGSVAPAARPLLAPTSSAHGATLVAVVTAFILALFPRPGEAWSWATIGKGGMILWPMFGATNQLLGGLSFLVIAFWLWRRRIPVLFAAIPMVFMLIVPAWAMLSAVGEWWRDGSLLLVFIAAVIIVLQAWMVIEALILWPRARGVLEAALPPLPARTKAAPSPDGGRSC